MLAEVVLGEDARHDRWKLVRDRQRHCTLRIRVEREGFQNARTCT
jgi:hypothetical protein